MNWLHKTLSIVGAHMASAQDCSPSAKVKAAAAAHVSQTKTVSAEKTLMYVHREILKKALSFSKILA